MTVVNKVNLQTWPREYIHEASSALNRSQDN